MGSDRKSYQKWVRALNKFIKKFPNLSNEIRHKIDELRIEYQKRPALLDEMLKIKGI